MKNNKSFIDYDAPVTITRPDGTSTVVPFTIRVLKDVTAKVSGGLTPINGQTLQSGGVSGFRSVHGV